MIALLLREWEGSRAEPHSTSKAASGREEEVVWGESHRFAVSGTAQSTAGGYDDPQYRNKTSQTVNQVGK